MADGIKQPKSMKKSILLSLIFSIAIIAIILYLTIDEATIEYLKTANMNYWFFLAAVLINLLYWLVWGARLKVLSDYIEPPVRIGLWESTKIVMANMFLANVTPSMAGGEPVRIYLLKRNGLTVGGATAAVIGERLLDAIFLLCCLPFGLIILGSQVDGGILKLAIGLAACLFFFALAAFIYAMKKPENMKRFLCWLSDKLSRFSKKKDAGHDWAARINEEVDRFHTSMSLYLSKGKKTLLSSFFFTAVFWMIGWLIPPLILMGLGLGPHFIESCAAQSLLVIIAMLPTTPGSAGVTEGGIAGLYVIFIPASIVGVFTLLYRFATYYVGLIVGAIAQHYMLKESPEK